jgi:hypothetical protein
VWVLLWLSYGERENERVLLEDLGCNTMSASRNVLQIYRGNHTRIDLLKMTGLALQNNMQNILSYGYDNNQGDNSHHNLSCPQALQDKSLCCPFPFHHSSQGFATYTR